eukprot:3940569-Rhodomonas_salina.4
MVVPRMAQQSTRQIAVHSTIRDISTGQRVGDSGGFVPGTSMRAVLLATRLGARGIAQYHLLLSTGTVCDSMLSHYRTAGYDTLAEYRTSRRGVGDLGSRSTYTLKSNTRNRIRGTTCTEIAYHTLAQYWVSHREMVVPYARSVLVIP